jgi:hypothetical protein
MNQLLKSILPITWVFIFSSCQKQVDSAYPLIPKLRFGVHAHGDHQSVMLTLLLNNSRASDITDWNSSLSNRFVTGTLYKMNDGLRATIRQQRIRPMLAESEPNTHQAKDWRGETLKSGGYAIVDATVEISPDLDNPFPDLKPVFYTYTDGTYAFEFTDEQTGTLLAAATYRLSRTSSEFWGVEVEGLKD